jgi:hypothetical protein
MLQKCPVSSFVNFGSKLGMAAVAADEIHMGTPPI